MKLINKSELHIEDGYILDEHNNVLNIEDNIIRLFNLLDTELQKAMYLEAQPKATPMPTLDGFERKSELSSPIEFSVATPVLDNKIQEAMDLMKELDKCKTGKEIQGAIDFYKPIIDFADKEKVLVYDDGEIEQVDTPFLKEYGGILKMTPADIFKVISTCCGAEFVNDDEVEDGEQE